MKCIKGDLIHLAVAGEFDVIIHGCNCFCAMGAGIAKQIRKTFPEAYDVDLATESGDESKLGNYSKVRVDTASGSFYIINGYTQYHYAGDGILADYKAIETLFSRIKSDFSGKRIGYPKIGAGLAGGNWEIISTIIDRALGQEDHTLVEFSSHKDSGLQNS